MHFCFSTTNIFLLLNYKYMAIIGISTDDQALSGEHLEIYDIERKI